MILIGGADQGEGILIGDGEENPTVFVLKDVGPVMIEQPWHHNVAAAYQPDVFAFAVHGGHAFDDMLDPRPGGVDQHLGENFTLLTGVNIFDNDAP